MVFELYEKGRTWISSLETDIVSITKTSISFGQDAIKEFGDDKFIEIYLDRKKKKVGFKSSNNSITGFKLTKPNTNGRVACTGKFLKLLAPGQFQMRVEDGYIVIEVLEIVDNIQTVKT